jgi:hypothetical protein
MTTFSIDSGGRIASCDSEANTRPKANTQGERFGSQRELANLTRTWPMTRLAGIWNRLPGVTPLDRFKDRKTAVERIWKAIQPEDPARASPVRSASGSRVPKQSSTHSVSKTAHILSMLERPEGVTLKNIMKATGWQAHSVRAFVSAYVIKKLGLRVKSFRNATGERAYRSVTRRRSQ